jgi:DNA polymerase
MQAMGVPVWLPKHQHAARPASVKTEPVLTLANSAISPTATDGLKQAMSVLAANELPAPKVQPAVTVAPLKAPTLAQGLDWQALQTAVKTCERCALSKTRTQTVFGVGKSTADLLVIGEAPGADEDRKGEPFVGKAGQLLNNMLLSIGLQRDDIYIANILKCRPPNNRDPKPDEAAQCRAYLEQQIALVQPKLILVVGRIAAQNLLQTDLPLGRLRNQLHTMPVTQIPVYVTYHPAYLLRQPADKRKAWQDLLKTQELLNHYVG